MKGAIRVPGIGKFRGCVEKGRREGLDGLFLGNYVS